jgi:putative ABC transport system permease protein
LTAILVMILRKMVKNRWLELSLLFGLVMTVALASSMPIYTNAILQRMLVKDLENLQHNTGKFPGTYWVSAFYPYSLDYSFRDTWTRELDGFMLNSIPDQIGLPIRDMYQERSSDSYKFIPADPTRVDATKERRAQIITMSGLEEHIRLVDGRMPAREPVGGVYEVLVIEDALNKLDMVLETEFVIAEEDVPAIRVKPVGVFDKKDYADAYWFNSLEEYRTSFFVPFDLFERDFTYGHKLKLTYSYWHLALDYSKTNLDTVGRFVQADAMVTQAFAIRFDSILRQAPALKVYEGYSDKEERLRLLLWSLHVPVLIVLGFYLFMVANLITDRQKTEISVLRSRGASRWQILLGYSIEGFILGAIAFMLGPYVGLALTQMLGASSGFLEFVQRAKLEVGLNMEAFRYAGIAVISSWVMTLIPAFLATRVSIVERKQQMARIRGSSIWHKLFLDVVLIALALYGLRTFNRRLEDMTALGLNANDLSIDPLLFVIPALFVLGAGLFVLRAYPWFIKLVFWAGRRWWSPSLYSTLLQVGRSTTQYQFIMVFMIMTIATGLFSASAARTINQNAEDKISYKNGSDIVIQAVWESDAPPESEGPGQMTTNPDEVVLAKKVQFSEPPFLPFAQLPGVEHAAKVFHKRDASLTVDKSRAVVDLMGIDTDDFGRTAWLRDDLLTHHFYDYLNLIAGDPSAVLISRSIAEELNARVGQTIYAGWNGVEPTKLVVYGIVDYWPGWNPNPFLSTSSKGAPGGKNAVSKPKLVVGHLSYIQSNMALEPYEIWLKLKPEATSQTLYQAIADQKLRVERMTDAKQQRIAAKNDPFQMAINGVMTLGFLVSMMISFLGFILYWVLSLSGRILQFGIMRAMGISFRQLVGMLVTEQALTTGAALFIGVVTGQIAGRLFVPLFQMAYDPATQVPPFRVLFDPRDELQLYLIVGTMTTIGLIALGYMLSRIKIHQAVKLGED